MSARAYLASPFGFTEAGRHYYRTVYLPTLSAILDVIDPWSFATEAEILTAQAQHHERDLWLEIGRRNQTAIRECDLLIADLDGQETDSGTASEIGFAAGLGKRCYGLRTDLRQNGENGVLVNLQIVSLIEESGGMIAPSLEDLVDMLRGDGY